MRRTSLFLLLAMATAGCDSLSDAVSADPRDLVQVGVSPASVPADGASRATVTARIPPASEVNDREIRLTTSSGTFLDEGTEDANIGVIADVNGVAQAVLRAPGETGSGVVQAISGNYSARATIEWVHAYPERIDVDPGVSALSASAFSTTVVTASLRRAIGVPTQGTAVSFLARDGNGQLLGSFVGVTPSDSSGEATAVFSPGATSYRGRAYIFASVTIPPTGQTIEGRATIEIVP